MRGLRGTNIYNEFHLGCLAISWLPHYLHARSSPPSPVAAFMGPGLIENQLEAARISDPDSLPS